MSSALGPTAVLGDPESASQPDGAERYRHLARGTEYSLLARGIELQTTAYLGEGASVVVYQGDDGSIWACREADFDDDRFQRLPDASRPEGAAPASIGWEDIKHCPHEVTDLEYDLPTSASQGPIVAYTEAGEAVCLVFWTYMGAGASETTHWAPLPTSLPTSEGRR